MSFMASSLRYWIQCLKWQWITNSFLLASIIHLHSFSWRQMEVICYDSFRFFQENKSSIIYLLPLLKTLAKWQRAFSASKTLDKAWLYSFFTSWLLVRICRSKYSNLCLRWIISSAICDDEGDGRRFAFILLFLLKSNIVFASQGII